MKSTKLNLSLGALAIGMLLISGCGRAGPSSTGYAYMAGAPAASEARSAAPKARTAADTAEPARAGTMTALAESRPDRYLIKNATLTVEARDVRQAAAALASAVQAARGYVSTTNESADDLGRRSVTMQARVPFAQFDRLLQRIDGLGTVLSKEVGAEDVTEEFVDSQAQLRNLKRTEQRLLEHLNRTARLADILLVEKELNRVRGEIERLEGRLRFLEHRVAYSTVTVNLQEAAGPQPMVPAATFSSGKVVADATRSLVGFVRVLWTAAIWLGIWAAVWVPFALVGWLAYRHRGREKMA